MHLHRRFLVSQTHETNNCNGLHALPKGKINHASKPISYISSNGLAYWSENYLSFLLIALCYICCVASHNYSLHSMISQWDAMCTSAKKWINGTRSDMQKSHQSYKPRVCTWECKSVLNYGQIQGMRLYLWLHWKQCLHGEANWG